MKFVQFQGNRLTDYSGATHSTYSYGIDPKLLRQSCQSPKYFRSMVFHFIVVYNSTTLQYKLASKGLRLLISKVLSLSNTSFDAKTFSFPWISHYEY